MDNAGQEAPGDQTSHNNEQAIQHMINIGREVVTEVQRSTSDMIVHFNNVAQGIAGSPPNGILPGHSSNNYESTIPQLQAEVARLEAELQNSIQLSEAKIRSLEDERSAQDKKYRELEIDLRDARADAPKASAELQRARADLQKARADRQLLNTLLIKGRTEDSERLDDEICKDFRGLGNDILKLVHKSFQAKIVLTHPRGLPSKKTSNWLSGWTLLSPELRNYRARGAVFDILFDEFFANPNFGYGGKTEKGLRQFELHMKDSDKISPNDVVEWRRRTVNAAKALGRITEPPESVATDIFETLTPVISPSGRTKASEQAILSEILEICVKAEHISWVLREGRATFQVAVASVGRMVERPEDSEVELVAMEGEPSSASAKVAHTVFGGLVKTTLDPGGDDVVVTLEKPIVVGYYA